MHRLAELRKQSILNHQLPRALFKVDKLTIYLILFVGDVFMHICHSVPVIENVKRTKKKKKTAAFLNAYIKRMMQNVPIYPNISAKVRTWVAHYAKHRQALTVKLKRFSHFDNFS